MKARINDAKDKNGPAEKIAEEGMKDPQEEARKRNADSGNNFIEEFGTMVEGETDLPTDIKEEAKRMMIAMKSMMMMIQHHKVQTGQRQAAMVALPEGGQLDPVVATGSTGASASTANGGKEGDPETKPETQPR